MVICRYPACICRSNSAVLVIDRANDFKNVTFRNNQLSPLMKLVNLEKPRFICEATPLALPAMSPDQLTATLMESFALPVAICDKLRKSANCQGGRPKKVK